MPGQRGAIVSIVALAVLIRLVHLLSIASTPILAFPQLFVESDMHMFDEWAKTIVAGDISSAGHTFFYQWQLDAAPAEQWNQWYGNAPIFHKAPFYAYLVALLRWTFAEPAIPLALLQIAAAGVSTFLLFYIARSVFGPFAAVAAGTLFALYGPSIHYDVTMLRRTWITLSMLAITFGITQLRARPTQARAIGLGLTLGFGIVLYEAFALLPLFVLGLMLWWFRFRAAFVLTGGVVLGMALALLPVFIRNYLVGAPLMSLAVTGSAVFSIFNSASAHPQLFTVDPTVFIPILEQSEGRFVDTALLSLKTFDGVGPAVIFYLKRALALVSAFEIPNNTNYYYAALQSPVLAILPGYRPLFATAVVGLAAALWKKVDISALLPCGLVALGILFATSPLSRYRMSLAIMFLPLAGFFWQYLWSQFRARRLVLSGMTLLAAAALYATSYWIEAKVFPAEGFTGPNYYRTTDFFLATDFYLSRGLSQEASNELRRMIELRKRFFPPELTSLAIRQARLGRFNAARLSLETARSNALAHPEILATIGDIYQRDLSDPRRARAVYQEALNAGPQPPLRKRLLESLRSLEGK